MDKIIKETARLVAEACLRSSVILTGEPLRKQNYQTRLSNALNASLAELGHAVILEPWGDTHFRILIAFGNRGGYMPVDNATGKVSDFVEVYEKAKQVA